MKHFHSAFRRPALVAILLVLALGAAACKTPRTPHRVAEGDVSGVWRAQSTEPVPTGWSLRLDQGDAGKIEGRGSRTRIDGTDAFSLKGIRGPREITMDLQMDAGSARFDGSVMSADMIVGRLYLNGDTIKLTLERD